MTRVPSCSVMPCVTPNVDPLPVAVVPAGWGDKPKTMIVPACKPHRLKLKLPLARWQNGGHRDEWVTEVSRCG